MVTIIVDYLHDGRREIARQYKCAYKLQISVVSAGNVKGVNIVVS